MDFSLAESPFAPLGGGRGGRPAVFVAGGRGPYDNTMEVLSRFDLSPARGRKVLLKPNAGRMTEPCSAVTTHPEAVAAAIDAFRNAGAEVSVGESPISGVRTMDAFRACGIAEVAEKRGCPLIDMDARQPLEVSIPGGVAIKSLRLCPEVAEHDIVVSMPVMKTHMHTGVTLAVKNMKGCLWRRSKVQLHMLPPVPGSDDKPINVAIADMAGVLRPHFSIVDGSYAMEGLGPSAGRARRLDVAVAGADAFAVDAVSCAVMGLDAADVPHLRIGGGRGYGVVSLSEIDVFPHDWRKMASPLERPPENICFEFPNVRVFDKNSCSACQSTLLLFLKHYGRLLPDYFPGPGNINIVIGKGNEEVPPGSLCIGNCTSRNKASGIYVSGCPPVSSEILRVLSGKPLFDHKDGHSEK